MSLSAPKLQNPCRKFIEFKGDSGVFQYWDKAAEKNVQLKMPISFIVLDELCTVAGFCDSMGAGIYSNEVKDLQSEVLNVRVFKTRHSLMGKYTDIKDRIGSLGGKFCKSVYAALIHEDGTLELVNFQLKGISFKSWLDKVVDLSLNAVVIKECTDGKKGAVKYKIPIYEALPVSRELMTKAIEMDKKLQEHLSTYLKNNAATFTEEPNQGVSGSPGSANHRGEPADFDQTAGTKKDDAEDDIAF